MLRLRGSSIPRAIAWLFAVAWIVVAVVAPRGFSLGERAGSREPSVAPAAAHDAGKALVRQARPLTVAAPLPEPRLPPLGERSSFRLERAALPVVDDVRIVAAAVSIRVVRWQRHVPRMDSGEPPRSALFAS